MLPAELLFVYISQTMDLMKGQNLNIYIYISIVLLFTHSFIEY